jgi:hypothetical protein
MALFITLPKNNTRPFCPLKAFPVAVTFGRFADRRRSPKVGGLRDATVFH